MEGKTLQVTLRVYRGPINYDADGNVKSENQAVVLTYGSGAWTNYLKHARLNHTSMKVEKVTEETMEAIDTGRKNAQGFKITRPEFSEEIIKTPESIEAEVLAAISAPVAELTPEQKRIADLEAIVLNLQNGKDATPDVNEEKEAAQARWEELKGKKPNHLTSLKRLNKEIKEMEIEQNN